MSEDTESMSLPTSGSHTPNSDFRLATVPKITYQDPASIQTTYAWGTPVDFVLSKSLGKVQDLILQIDIDNNAANVEATSYLPPTPFWFERLEISLGGSAPIETVNKDELFMETLMYLPMNDFQTIASSVNINSNGSFISTGTNYPGANQTRYFLPLWANCLNSAQPYLKGFNAEFKLRFVLSTAQPTIANGGASASQINITGLRILATEAQLPPNVEQRLAWQHSKGIVYSTVNRIRHLDTNMPTSTTSIKEYQLTTFSNESAGLLTYFRDGDNRYSNLGRRLQLTNLNFRDAQGNPYYATDLDGNFNLYFINPAHVGKEPLVPGTTTSTYNYIIPFSSNVGAVLESGKDLGAYQLSGKEKITLQPRVLPSAALAAGGFSTPADLAAVPVVIPPTVFIAVSYDYMRLKVKGGNCRVYYNRG